MVQLLIQQTEQPMVSAIRKISGKDMSWHGVQDIQQKVMDAISTLNILSL